MLRPGPAAGFGGLGRGRLLIPQQIAQKLRIAQPTDLREMLRGTDDKPTYDSLTVRVSDPKAVPAVEDTIKKMGFGTFSILDATKNLQLFFTVFDLLLGDLRQPSADGVVARNYQHTGDGNPRAARAKSEVLKALGAADRDVRAAVFCRSRCDGLLGGNVGASRWLAIGRALTFGTNLYLARQQLPSIDLSSVHWWMAGRRSGFRRGEFGCGHLSGGEGGAAEPGRGAAV